MEKVERRGGKRPNAGRKPKAPEEKAVMVSFSCSKEQKGRIVELAGENKVGISEYIRTVLFGN